MLVLETLVFTHSLSGISNLGNRDNGTTTNEDEQDIKKLQ